MRAESGLHAGEDGEPEAVLIGLLELEALGLKFGDGVEIFFYIQSRMVIKPKWKLADVCLVKFGGLQDGLYL